jgi:hypothetical protein
VAAVFADGFLANKGSMGCHFVGNLRMLAIELLKRSMSISVL